MTRGGLALEMVLSFGNLEFWLVLLLLVLGILLLDGIIACVFYFYRRFIYL